MYRTGDPRFRRRLNEIGQTLESANESAQSNIYIFGQTYVKPCFESLASSLTACVDAGCPTLNVSQRDRLRRQRGRGRSRGRAELNFDFYDDWDDEENDALMQWGDDDFGGGLTGGGSYGTVAQTQPARQKGMNYPKARRKSTVLPHDGGTEPSAIPGSSFFGNLFGGKALKYKPSAAGLQEHPRATRLGHDLTEGEALLREGDESNTKRHRRTRSSTVTSGHTTDSLSSRGDLFPSDEEDDAIPLDDEFAMVLERRATQSGPETESSSGKTRTSGRRDKRPSAGSRTSTRGTRSSYSSGGRHRRSSSLPLTSEDEEQPDMQEAVLTLGELKQEERRATEEEEADIERKRQEASKLAAERGLIDMSATLPAILTKRISSPVEGPTPELNDPLSETRQGSGLESGQIHDGFVASTDRTRSSLEQDQDLGK